MEEARAVARTEPNSALCLWYRTDPDAKEPACAVLGSSGIALLEVDSLADYFYGTDLAPGLWVFENAAWWTDHGSPSNDYEYDCGIEGDWRRATQDDLARFGLSMETVDVEIANYLEVDPRTGLASEYLAMADETSEPETAPSP